VKAATLKRKYGLTPPQHAAMIEATGGRCVLCRKRWSRTRLPAIDHRHIDGLVRGIVCVQCNDKLGFLHDDAGWLTRAANYLDRPPALAIIGVHFVPGSLGAAKSAIKDGQVVISVAWDGNEETL